MHVFLDRCRQIGSVPHLWLGTNAGIWLGPEPLDSPRLRRQVRGTFSLVRWPGGSTANRYHFDGDYPPFVAAQDIAHFTSQWRPDTVDFVAWTRAMGAEPLIVVNHGVTAYGAGSADRRLEAAAHLAARWVAYCNRPLRGDDRTPWQDEARARAARGHAAPLAVRYFEVGNEVFGTWEVGHVDGATYGRHFVAFARAMRQADPDIFIGAPVSMRFDDPDVVQWMRGFLSTPDLARWLDFVDLHEYFRWAPNGFAPTEAMLRRFVGELEDKIAGLEHLLARSGLERTRIFLGEFNLSHPSNPATLSWASGLLTGAILGRSAHWGLMGAAHWDLVNQFENGGDLGMFSRGAPHRPDFSPYADYYPYYFFSHNFGDRLLFVDQDAWDVDVFASVFTDGSVGLVAINPTGSPRRLHLTFAAPVSGALAGWIATAPALDAHGVSLNETGIRSPVGGPLMETVPPLVRFGPTTTAMQLPLPARSAVSYVLYGTDPIGAD